MTILSIQPINAGASPNDGTGAKLRDAFITTNENMANIASFSINPEFSSATITGSALGALTVTGGGVFGGNLNVNGTGVGIYINGVLVGSGAGTVLSASVVTANGFAGNVANSMTAPAITLSTTVDGILIGNNSQIQALTVGNNLTLANGILSANSSGGGTEVVGPSTWVPVVTDMSGNVISGSIYCAQYTKVGRLVNYYLLWGQLGSALINDYGIIITMPTNLADPLPGEMLYYTPATGVFHDEQLNVNITLNAVKQNGASLAQNAIMFSGAPLAVVGTFTSYGPCVISGSYYESTTTTPAPTTTTTTTPAPTTTTTTTPAPTTTTTPAPTTTTTTPAPTTTTTTTPAPTTTTTTPAPTIWANVAPMGGSTTNGLIYGVAVNSSGLFVAVGSDGINGEAIAAHSTDGITWSQQAHMPGSGIYVNMNSVAVNSSSLFVGVGFGQGNRPLSAYSSDGINWSSPAYMNGSAAAAQMQSVAYGNGKFVAVGFDSSNYPTAAYSSDGMTWTTPATMNGSSVIAYMYGVTVDSTGRFVAVGYDSSNHAVAAHSTDGITWTTPATMDVSVTAMMRSVTVNSSGLFVAIGWNTYYEYQVTSYSSDGGATWSIPAGNNGYGISTHMYGITVDLTGRFVAVGRDQNNRPLVSYSTDGMTWPLPVHMNVSLYLYAELHSVAVSPTTGKLVAVGLVINTPPIATYTL